MADKPKKQQIILKRQVLTKAYVTPKFKKFLENELIQNIKQFKQKLGDIVVQLNSLDESNPAFQELQKEKIEAQAYIDSEADQKKFINDLEPNSLYSQGPVDGFVTVSVGDNLYSKLGGVEIIVKDGVVQKISMNKSQFDIVTG